MLVDFVCCCSGTVEEEVKEATYKNRNYWNKCLLWLCISLSERSLNMILRIFRNSFLVLLLNNSKKPFIKMEAFCINGFFGFFIINASKALGKILMVIFGFLFARLLFRKTGNKFRYLKFVVIVLFSLS